MTRVAAAIVLTAMSGFAVSHKTAVIGSQHDLSLTGSAPVKSAVADACIFCHAPHNVNPNIIPLWDHALSSQSYTTYTSSTYTSGPQTPAAGSSKLCLSCHDGTVAVGLTTAYGLIATTGSMTAKDVLGTNLATSHPLSMTPVDDGSLATSLFATPPSTKDPAVVLVASKVECTTCHDPHVPNNDPAAGMFLARANSGGTMCLACHDPTRAQPNFLNGWTTSSHATAANTVPTTAGFGPYGAVGLDACSSCHLGHNNAVGPRDLRALEGAACTPCHSGTNASPALLNVTAEFSKAYAHPTFTVTGVHDPAESLPVNSTRHAACADCHNSHTAYAQTGTALAPTLQASMTGVSGWDSTGAQRPAAKEYQVCFKCHADSTNKPGAGVTVYGRTAARYPLGLPTTLVVTQPPVPADQYNLRLKGMSTIGHNTMGNSIATTTNPSLLPFMLNINGTNNTARPLTTSSIIYCSDCHNSDQARSSGGTGPNGTHGSAFRHLLQLNLLQDGTGGGGTGAALCGKCHNLTTVRGETPHGEHGGVGCTTCHDPHGVIGGNPVANRAMMNFDTGVAAKTSSGYFGFYYISTASRGCYTNCHGENHNPHGYSD